MKPKEIAERINAHLKRLEADPELNAQRWYTNSKGERHSSGRPFYGAWARGGTKLVSITYVAYQGTTKLDADAAQAYLEWLDAGNAGTHYEQQSAKAATS